jgi:hypothetical protein
MGADGNKEGKPVGPAVMCSVIRGRVRNHSQRHSTIGLGLRAHHRSETRRGTSSQLRRRGLDHEVRRIEGIRSDAPRPTEVDESGVPVEWKWALRS